MNFKRLAAAMAVAASVSMNPANMSAQARFAPRIEVGTHGGVTFSRMFFNPSVPQSFRAGGSGGVGVRYIEEKHFGLLAELNFVQRGWRESFDDTPQFQYSRALNYLELPVMAHIYFGSDKGRFFVNAGPQICLLMSESTTANFNPQEIGEIEGFPDTNRSNDQMKMPAENKLDFGISAGLGGELQVGRRNSLYIEGRFYYGLGNIYRSKRTDPFNASNSMTVMATIGWWFRIK